VRTRRLLRQLPSKHATAHAGATGHPYIQSYEPGEDWFYNFTTRELYEGPELHEPTSHPADGRD